MPLVNLCSSTRAAYAPSQSPRLSYQAAHDRALSQRLFGAARQVQQCRARRRRQLAAMTRVNLCNSVSAPASPTRN